MKTTKRIEMIEIQTVIKQKIVIGYRIDVNYRIITLILKKYGNLPLCLENYALFLLSQFYRKIIYIYIKLYNLSRRTIG